MKKKKRKIGLSRTPPHSEARRLGTPKPLHSSGVDSLQLSDPRAATEPAAQSATLGAVSTRRRPIVGLLAISTPNRSVSVCSLIIQTRSKTTR